MKQLLKPLATLLLLILVCAVLVRIISGSETLADYATRNPEIAYATHTPTISPSPTCTPTPTATPTPTPIPKLEESLPMTSEAPEAVIYAEGFYYEPLSEDLITRITGVSYPMDEQQAMLCSRMIYNTIADPVTLAISLDDLRYLRVQYYDFDGIVQQGELICNKAIADDLSEIFYTLYQNEYQIEKIRLVDEYNGDDTQSMLDNNTSCFNYRMVDNSSSLSKHALGLAIDINPFYNPYVVFQKDGSTYISPEGSEPYADRSASFPYKIDENDLCYKLFKEHGFTWGGDWNSCKDYQHFQKTL